MGGDELAERGVLLVEGAPRRDEGDQSSGTDTGERRGEEVVVDEELRKTRVERTVIAKRDVRDGEVEGIGMELRFLERLMAKVRLRIQRLGETQRHAVDLDAGKRGSFPHRLGHQAEEMAQATGGFEDPAAGKAETLQGSIHRLDDRRCRVVGVECGGSGTSKLGIREQLPKLDAFAFPLGIALIEHLRQAAPADVPDQHRPLLVRGVASLSIEALEQSEGREVVATLLWRGADTQAVAVENTKWSGDRSGTCRLRGRRRKREEDRLRNDHRRGFRWDDRGEGKEIQLPRAFRAAQRRTIHGTTPRDP